MRLIDADAIKYTEYINGDITVSKEEIERQQTAYDTGKVVEELEKESYQEFCDSPKIVELKEAIEIVKHGGVSDDVCEWKYNDTEYYWESSCGHLHIFMADGPKQNEYSFCPYCSKKIKAVE